MRTTHRTILHKHTDVFICPLHTLITSRTCRLSSAVATLNVNINILANRAIRTTHSSIFTNLTSNHANVILAAPRFLSVRHSHFTHSNHVNFIIVSRTRRTNLTGNNSHDTCLSVPSVLGTLNSPIIVTTATATATPIITRLTHVLPVAHAIISRAIHRGLRLRSSHSLTDHRGHLISVITAKRGAIVCIGSHSRSITLTGALHGHIPSYTARVTFCGTKLTHSSHHHIRRTFQSKDLDYVISASTFNRNIGLPSVHRIILCRVPFNTVRFGRVDKHTNHSKRPTIVRLLCSSHSTHVGRHLLSYCTPRHSRLIALCHTLRAV